MGMGGPPMAPGGMGGPGASGPGGASGGRVLNFSPGLDVAVPVNNSADPSWNARFQNVGAAWVDQRQHGPGTGDVAVFVWPKPITPAGIPSNIAMSGTALWTLDVLSPSATGLAIADDDLNYGSYKVTWHWPKTTDENGASETDVPDSFVGWLPGPLLARPSEGESYRVKIAPDGIIVPMRTREAMVISDPDAGGHLIAGVKPFPFAHFFIQLPTEPVGAGDTWQGSMGVIQGLTDLLVRLVDGVTFKLEDFEYRGTHRCARITATYTESGVKIPWEMPALGSAKGPALTAGPGGSVSGNPLSALTGALNTYAGQMNAAMNGTDFPTGSMPLGGPPGAPAGPGAMGPGGGQTSAVGPDGEPQGTLKGDITVRRTVYFDLDDGRFLSFDDAITKKITKILAPPESQGMGMGMGAGMGMGMSSSTTTKLDYRDLTSTDVQPLMGQLVGAGGTGSGQGGPGGGGPGGPGGMPMPGGFMPGMGGPPMGGMPMGGPPMGGGMGGGMPGAAAVPSVKATISITTNLSLTEIGQVAGHAVSPY